MTISRRDLIRHALAGSAALLLPLPLRACADAPARDAELAAGGEGPHDLVGAPDPEELRRLTEWVATLRAEGLADDARPFGLAVARVGELAIGAPYVPSTLDEYLRVSGAPPRAEPLTLDLARFDCVTLVEACLAVARLARQEGPPAWSDFAREIERVRYRDGRRVGYASRLHYFSEWMADNDRRGLVRRLGQELGGVPDTRPLRFMTEHVDAYPALADPRTVEEIAAIERELDDQARWVVPPARISEVEALIQTGDVLAFATRIEGLDVTHSAFAYRDEGGVLRVLHAPLSGGEVEITDSTLPEYVAAIRNATGILIARPLPG